MLFNFRLKTAFLIVLVHKTVLKLQIKRKFMIAPPTTPILSASTAPFFLSEAQKTEIGTKTNQQYKELAETAILSRSKLSAQTSPFFPLGAEQDIKSDERYRKLAIKHLASGPTQSSLSPSGWKVWTLK